MMEKDVEEDSASVNSITDEKTSLVPKDSFNKVEYGVATNPMKKKTLAVEDLDVLYTYWVMKARQWERIHKGTYKKPKNFSAMWFLFFLLVYLAYLGLQIFYFRRTKDWILEYILMAFMSGAIATMIPRFSWFFKVILMECYAFFLVFFLMDLYWEESKYIPLGIGTAGLILVTFIGFMIYPYIFHCYLECTGSVTPKLPAPKEGPVGPSTEDTNVRIEFEQKSCIGTSVECVYQGQIRDGKPHGLGVWIDTSIQGEFLQGWWEDGVPRGPFESMENGTRSYLVNLRIFFACDAGGKMWLERVPLTFGIASVECCVSGNFFKSYPRAEMIMGPETCPCEKKCKCVTNLLKGKNWRHIDDEKHLRSVSVSVDRNQLNVTGHKPLTENHDSISIKLVKEPNNVYKLALDDQWTSSGETEALLFIHGYDHNLVDALKRFGQFLALGHFPSYIKPFVFNWPSSTNPAFYWCAHSVASDNDIHRDLKKFIYSMRAAGIKQLHVMCHSMGTRFFLRSWATIKELFSVRFMSPHTSYNSLSDLEKTLSPTEGIHLQNLIFLNPDYELATFKNDYNEIRAYCSKVSIYADHRDAAIRLAFRLTSKPSLGNNVNPLMDGKGNLLDIDLVDTSDLDRNTNSSFHSFFNVNRLMVDDLWDLIVTGKRAAERTSRLKRWGKVYRFTILPSSVVMV